MAAERKPIGFYLATGWMGLCVLMSTVGGYLPLPNWRIGDYDNLGVGLFSPGHLLGTDTSGIDQLSAVIHGTRLSLTISFTAVILGIIIGGFLGILAAYSRGWLDSIILMYFNVSLSIPTIILALALVSILASSDSMGQTSALERIGTLILTLTIVLIPILGRIARASALSWTGRDFVLAAKAMGMKPLQIMWYHILPNVVPTLLSIGFLAAGVLIVVEGGLAILGAGVLDGSTWGAMLATNRQLLTIYPHTTLIPAAAIAMTVLSLNYFADYIRNIIDGRESRL